VGTRKLKLHGMSIQVRNRIFKAIKEKLLHPWGRMMVRNVNLRGTLPEVKAGPGFACPAF
jgi:hypothetical protein